MTINSEIEQMSIPTEKVDVSNENVDVTKSQEQEIKEALEIIYEAIRHLDKALSKISTASDWGLFDIFCGGGIVSSVVKQGKMSDANHEMKLANECVNKLKKELNDIENISNLQISGLLSFMDIFFDNIFSDIMVQNEIADAQKNCRKARSQLVTLKKELEERLDPSAISEIKAEKKTIKEKLEDVKAALEASIRAIKCLQKNIRPLEKAIDTVENSISENKIDKIKMRLRESNKDLDILYKNLKNVRIDITDRSHYLKFIEISNGILACDGKAFDKQAVNIFRDAKQSCLKTISEIESIKNELNDIIIYRKF